MLYSIVTQLKQISSSSGNNTLVIILSRAAAELIWFDHACIGTIGMPIHCIAYPYDSALLILTHWSVAEEHLADLAEWQEPQAGMFAWLKLCGGIKDADEILDKLKEEKVVVVPGSSSNVFVACLSVCLSVCLCISLSICLWAV